jgi:hypothetical protein
MAPGPENMPHAKYEVLKPIEMRIGPVSLVLEFGAEGDSLQYAAANGRTIQQLIDDGYLRRLP